MWNGLVVGIVCLKYIVRVWSGILQCRGWYFCNKVKDVKLYFEIEKYIIREVQNEVFLEEIRCIRENKDFNRGSLFLKLYFFLDSDGIVCVGG